MGIYAMGYESEREREREREREWGKREENEIYPKNSLECSSE